MLTKLSKASLANSSSDLKFWIIPSTLGIAKSPASLKVPTTSVIVFFCLLNHDLMALTENDPKSIPIFTKCPCGRRLKLSIFNKGSTSIQKSKLSSGKSKCGKVIEKSKVGISGMGISTFQGKSGTLSDNNSTKSFIYEYVVSDSLLNFF